ncbi:MAG: GNAT family N-acetyltransferase [Proteobacteria bacterium]|nr:GNAT family N-acetyltransferase [Pseudomonadota bacterium]
MMDLSTWTARPLPQRQTLAGRYCRLEPFSPAHEAALFVVSMAGDAEARHRWLFEGVSDAGAFHAWFTAKCAQSDPLYFAVIDQASGAVTGRQCFMRIDAANGVIEIGSILWGMPMARTRLATEALYLFARHVFEDLGYRRFEWKCNNENEPSKRAALRFGFTYEGLFRQHMVQKGKNRDTAWFSMIDSEWPRLKAAFEGWLAPENFDANGQQIRRLEAFRG